MDPLIYHNAEAGLVAGYTRSLSELVDRIEQLNDALEKEKTRSEELAKLLAAKPGRAPRGAPSS